MKSFFSICLGLLIIACAPKADIQFERTGAVEFVEGDKSTLTVNAHGYAKDMGNAVIFAERNALENILFKGIPNSNQENPMIANESDAYRNSKKALDDLILKGGYQRFMIESYNQNNRKSGRGINVRQIIKFDMQALRKHLEDEKIVRKFGL